MMILSREPAVSHLENVTAKPANLAAKRGSERRERESGSLSKSVALVVHRFGSLLPEREANKSSTSTSNPSTESKT